jgi:hypothetical protein
MGFGFFQTVFGFYPKPPDPTPNQFVLIDFICYCRMEYGFVVYILKVQVGIRKTLL